MLSSKSIGSFLVTLLVVFSAIGQLHNPVYAPGLSVFEGRNDAWQNGRHKQSTSFQAFSARPGRQKETTQKRHKRLLISKVFQPVAMVTFLKRYRLMAPSLTDYSSPHILHRPVASFPLRGPPVV
ncbi:MAG TPA: hypothetical protein VLD19_05135 [Chitinophagaceae bacterium]|nr:hypothetical protein [Chitinophagaceae bacterium]